MRGGSWCTVRAVTIAPAAALVRTVASLLAAVAVFVSLVVGRADGAQSTVSSLLAPVGICQAAETPHVSDDAQIRAVACLLNWARVQAGHSRLSRRPALQRAAVLKGRRVASCGQLSHTPCGSAVTASINAAGYRYGWFGENLFAGSWRSVTARDVVSAWLNSPGHRANVLAPRFRHVGLAPVRARGLLGGTDAVVWTATFASPR